MARESRDWWHEQDTDFAQAVRLDSQLNGYQPPLYSSSSAHHRQRPPGGPAPNHKTHHHHKNELDVEPDEELSILQAPKRPNLRIDTTAPNRIKPNVQVVQQHDLVRKPVVRKRQSGVESSPARQRRVELYQKTLRKESGLADLLDMWYISCSFLVVRSP